MRRSITIFLPLLAFVSLVVACEREGDSRITASRQSPIVPLDTGTVLVDTRSDTFSLSVEIAETPNQTEIGLMERVSMPADEGMIFLFSETRDPTAAFWMYRTRIPLDIAYLDREGRIVAIRQMEPCASPNSDLCETYPPGVPYTAALEVNRGYFASRGIGLGDRIVLRRAGSPWPKEDRPSNRAPGG
jgi:uncharacterized membrane protein (UPF0127 family)